MELKIKALSASCGMRCGVWTVIGGSFVTVEIGMMTLSSSSFRTGSENVAGGGSKGCSMMGADVGVLAGAGEGALVGEVVGLSRGDRRVGWLGISAKPGVLLRVTRPCLRGVVLTT